MKLMIGGVWRGEVDPPPHPDAQRIIQRGFFRHRVTADGSSGFKAEAGRYHLYISYACPFAHRTLAVRALKGLESAIPVSVLHPRWNTAEGWVFEDTPFSTPDRGGSGFTHLFQAYAALQQDYTGKVTVPVLWDGKTHRIVSNESARIALMLNDEFNAFSSSPSVDLHPEPLRAQIADLSERIHENLASGVYAVGGARDQSEYDEAIAKVFALLDSLETRLSDGRPYLHGDTPLLSDVFAFTPLVRFDIVYNPLFRASLKRLADYPALSAYVGRVYSLPGLAGTVKFDHILMHYHDGDWGVANRRGIVPTLPSIDFRSVAEPVHFCKSRRQTQRSPAGPASGT